MIENEKEGYRLTEIPFFLCQFKALEQNKWFWAEGKQKIPIPLQSFSVKRCGE